MVAASFVRLSALVCLLPLSGFACPLAYATDTVLPIKVRIVRCVTQAERLNTCHQEGMCCEFLDPDSEDSLRSKVSFMQFSPAPDNGGETVYWLGPRMEPAPSQPENRL